MICFSHNSEQEKSFTSRKLSKSEETKRTCLAIIQGLHPCKLMQACKHEWWSTVYDTICEKQDEHSKFQNVTMAFEIYCQKCLTRAPLHEKTDLKLMEQSFRVISPFTSDCIVHKHQLILLRLICAEKNSENIVLQI